MLNAGHAADHGVPADPRELVNGAEPAEEGPVPYLDMAGKCRVVRHDHMIAHLAVMGDMHADHEQPVVADPRDHAAPGGAGIHGDVLADRVVGADDKLRGFALILEVLGDLADRGERENLGAGPDGGAAVDHRVGGDAHPLH